MTELLVGVSSVGIDPPLPFDPQGFVRRARAVRRYGDPLTVRACVVKRGALEVAICAADMANIDQAFAQKIREVIERQTGIPFENILLNSSHTHAAPWARVDHKLHGEFEFNTEAETAFFNRLPFDYASAVILAQERLMPARISGGVGRAPGIAVNRRERTPDGRTILGWNPEGFVDEDVPTIRIDSVDGLPIATVVGFGCHPVVLGGEVELSGPDFVGALRDDVEARRGGVCLFLQGAAGNVLPLEAFHAQPGPEKVMGSRLATAALESIVDQDPRAAEIVKVAYGSVTPISLYRRQVAENQTEQSFHATRKVLELPLLAPMTRGAMEVELVSRRSELSELERRSATRAEINPIAYHVRWLESMIARSLIGELPRSVSTEINAIRLGDTAIVGTPGELFSELGAEVRRRSPFPTTIFAGYCQGVLGYVATAEEYAFGGYEPAVAQRGYGMPAPFAPEAGHILVEQAVALLELLNDPGY